MAVHVVGFTDIIRYEGNTPIFKGRELLSEYNDTAAYKKLKPGDCVRPYVGRPLVVWDFVEAKPFSADLHISRDYTIAGSYVTLQDAKTQIYYPMFLQDFVAMASVSIVVRGRITGRFGFVKKNKMFGINYLGEM